MQIRDIGIILFIFFYFCIINFHFKQKKIMKFYLLAIAFSPFFCFSQNENNTDEFYLANNTGERVFINKNVTSYGFTVDKYVNDKKIESKDYINFKKPVASKIFITTDENLSSIRINSPYYKEDIILKFKRLYKYNIDNRTYMYEFTGGNSCSASYVIPPNNENQILFLKCLNSEKSGSGMNFTMSRNEQL